MYWFVGAALALFVLIRCHRIAARARVCSYVVPAQQALERRDYQAFDQNLERAERIAERLPYRLLREEFLGGIALMRIQGAYWRGDLAGAQTAGHRAVEILTSLDGDDGTGRLGSAHIFLGDVFLDCGQLGRAEAEFRAAATLAELGPAPFVALFPLQRLADTLLEQGKQEEAIEVVERCVEIEKVFFAGQPAKANQAPSISMSAPDRSLVQGDFATAERLFEEKVRHFGGGSEAYGIDVLRYQLHLAEAQKAQGKLEQARATLTSACSAVEKQFGADHPRATRIRRKLEAIPAAATLT